MTISILRTILTEKKHISKKNFISLLVSLCEQLNDDNKLIDSFTNSNGLELFSLYFNNNLIEEDDNKKILNKEEEEEEIKKNEEETFLLNKLLLNLLSLLLVNQNFINNYILFPPSATSTSSDSSISSSLSSLSLSSSSSSPSLFLTEDEMNSSQLIIERNSKFYLNFVSLCSFKYLLLDQDFIENHPDLLRFHYTIIFNLLETFEKVFPSYIIKEVASTKTTESDSSSSTFTPTYASYSEYLKEDKVVLTFGKDFLHYILLFLKENLTNLNKLSYSLTLDFISNLLTLNYSFKESNLVSQSTSEVDRNDTLEQRKLKNSHKLIGSFRSYYYSYLLLEYEIINLIVSNLSHENISIRRASTTTFGVFIRGIDQYSSPREEMYNEYLRKEKKNFMKKNENLKEDEILKKIDEENEKNKKNLLNLSEIQKILLTFLPGKEYNEENLPFECECFNPCTCSSKGIPSLSFYRLRQRAALEAALLSTHLELGAWLVNHPSGGNGRQLLRLASCPYIEGVEAACEVLCLAANNDSLTDLLYNLSKENVFDQLIKNSNDLSIKATAASTILKLIAKRKTSIVGSSSGGLSEDVYNSLTAANEIIKLHLKEDEKSHNKDNLKDNSKKNEKLVSFSSFDNTSSSSISDSSSFSSASSVLPSTSTNSTLMSPLERSIEALAILSKNFKIKQYISKEIIQNIAKINIENYQNSSCIYGITHIISSLTVTNRELLILALREKEMTIDQYEKMKELQRINTKESEGAEILKDNLEDLDEDTAELCKLRIKLCVDSGILKLLTLIINSTLKSLSHSNSSTPSLSVSSLALEQATKSLRQICVNENVRGSVIQQGAFHACLDLSLTTSIPANIRREAAHVIAKTLVTTNPHLLSESLRYSSIRSLIHLCKDVDSTNLQQFESLLSLTNLLSCGEGEQDRLLSENNLGINTIYQLIFSENKMITRAAIETFCNLSSHKGLIKLLKKKENIKIWLSFCEMIFNYEDDNNEKILVTSIDSLPSDEKYYSLANDMDSEEFKTSSAAIGTLAVACDYDKEISKNLLDEDVKRTIAILIKSKSIPLIHRALVLALNLIQGEHAKYAVFNCGFSSKEFLELFFDLPAVSPIEEIAQEFIQTLSSMIKSK